MSGKRATSPSKIESARLRRLERGDLEAAHGLSVAVGWPHRLADWQTVFEIGHGYCAYDAIGRLAGTAMWWPMEPDFAMVGMVIVDPGLQSQGLGRKLMRAVFEATSARALELHSTAAGIKLYESEGFRAVGGLEQHQGTARLPKAKPLRSVKVRPWQALDWGAILELDRAAYGYDRREVLSAITRGAAGMVCESEARMTGFAFCRNSGRGQVIGPIVADDASVATELARSFIADREGQFLRVDIPEGSSDFTGVMVESGLLPAGPATTMVRGSRASRKGPARVFGLVNQAIG